MRGFPGIFRRPGNCGAKRFTLTLGGMKSSIPAPGASSHRAGTAIVPPEEVEVDHISAALDALLRHDATLSDSTRETLEAIARRLERSRVLHSNAHVSDTLTLKAGRDFSSVSEEQLRALVETTPECVKLIAPDGTLLQMNPSGLAMIEADSAAAVAGKKIYDVIVPEDRPRFRAFNEAVCNGAKGTLEFDIVGLRGTRRHMETHAVPFLQPDGSTVQLAITRDITRRKQIEAERVETAALFHAFVTATSDVVYRMNGDWSEMRRLEGKDFIADTVDPDRGWLERYIPVDERARVQAAIREAINNKAPFELEHRVKRTDGSVGWTFSRAIPRLGPTGEITEWIGAARDVTERRRARDDLHKVNEESEQQRRLYDTVLSNTPDLVYVFGLDHRFRYANEALLKMWGRSWAEAAGKNCLELGYEPWHAAMHDREIEQVVATKRPVRGVVPFTGTNGRRIYDYIFVPVLGPAGTVEAIAGTTRDITELKRKEDTLRFLIDLGSATQKLSRPEDIMSATAKILGDHLGVDRCAYAEVEDETIFVITGDYPKNAPSIVGRWPVAAFGKACSRQMLANESYVVSDSEADARIGPEDLAAYRATKIRAVICVPLHKAGKFTAAMAVHQTQPRPWTQDEIDLVEMVVARCWESLERARVFRSLEENEQRLRFMADSMPQKIFTADSSGGVDFVNPAWVEYLGRPAEDVFGWAWLQYVHPDDRAPSKLQWESCVASGQPFQCEHRFRRHDGDYRWHLTRAQALRDAEGRIGMWLGSNTEIEEQKRIEEELERSVAERTAKLRDTIGELEAFSYSIAHDMRAPLRSLYGFSDVLLTEHAHRLDCEGQEYLRRIHAAAARMDRLIQDVLNYSRIVRGEARLYRIDLNVLLRGILETYPMFGANQADIRIEEPIPAVMGNEAMLTQIFSNLLGNAVKFVRPGAKPAITVSASVEGDSVRVAVRDNGIGIAQDQHQKIFEIFQQAETTYGGTGIGLAIVKKAVERMGGRVGVISVPGDGSTFWIEVQRA